MADPESHDPGSEKRKARQSPTDIINRNEFLLFRLQSELKRLKAESASAKEESTRVLRSEDADPEKILREANEEIELLKRRGALSKSDRLPPTRRPKKE